MCSPASSASWGFVQEHFDHSHFQLRRKGRNWIPELDSMGFRLRCQTLEWQNAYRSLALNTLFVVRARVLYFSYCCFVKGFVASSYISTPFDFAKCFDSLCTLYSYLVGSTSLCMRCPPDFMTLPSLYLPLVRHYWTPSRWPLSLGIFLQIPNLFRGLRWKITGSLDLIGVPWGSAYDIVTLVT